MGRKFTYLPKAKHVINANHVLMFLAGCFVTNLWASTFMSSYHDLQQGPPIELECFKTPGKGTKKAALSLPLETVTPVVIISALRPQYLEPVLESIDSQHQHPNTPAWIGQSPRYLFLHRHGKNNVRDASEKVLALAEKHNFTVVEFPGLYDPKLAMNVNANLVWYKMMRHLFRNLGDGIREAFILEEDVLLAPDALLVAARLLQEKRQRRDIHSIALGGWFGMNKINPDPVTFMALRSSNFQPMAYSLDSEVFQHLEEQKRQLLMEKPLPLHVPDWTEEITLSGFIQNLTILSPSVSRMHHIGATGMGASGKGNQNRTIDKAHAWDFWQQTLIQPNRSMQDMCLEPTTVTDWYGFVCHPIRAICSKRHVSEWMGSHNINRPNSVSRIPQTTHMMPEEEATKLDPPLRIVHAESSSKAVGNHESAALAIDGDMYTRWNGRQRHNSLTWIRVDLGRSFRISSISIHWEDAFATHYNIQTSTDLETFETIQSVEDGQGMEDFFAFSEATMPTARYIVINCIKNVHPSWDYSIWEIIVRGTEIKS